MEKLEHPVVMAASTSSLELAPKKLARQLEFSSSFPAPVQPIPAVHRAAHSLAKPPSSPPPSAKPESPKPQAPTGTAEIKDHTPKKPKQCNCKNSRCLKLYCECFASGIYCDGCNCLNCHNNMDHEASRQEAIGATLERNPNAFRPKIANSPHGSRMGKPEVGPAQVVVKHNKGCNCKKSGCLKKYCECFQANILCSDNCKCVDCKNFKGSEERRALILGTSSNMMIYQAANAAINGAIGSSGYGNSPASRKRRSQELSFVRSYNNQPVYHNALYTQGNHVKYTTPSLQPEPISHVNAQAVAKVTYRSPLAGVIQPQDVKELCSLLVIVSKEAAKTAADNNPSIMNQEKQSEVETCNDIPSEQKTDAQRLPNFEKDVPENVSTDDQAVGMCDDSSVLDESDLQLGRPASPGTIALMCYEQDTVLMEGGSPREIAVDCQNVVSDSFPRQSITEDFAEQERVVLTRFRDFLNRLITCGSIKETMCSSLTGSEPETQAQPARSGHLKDGQLCNGVIKPLPIVNHAPSEEVVRAYGSKNGFTQNVGNPMQNGVLTSKIEKAVQQ